MGRDAQGTFSCAILVAYTLKGVVWRVGGAMQRMSRPVVGLRCIINQNASL